MKPPGMWERTKRRLGISKRKSAPALNDLDNKLSKYLDFRDGFFIEAGANDGYSQSNTYLLETERNWRGILIEGIPELYARCKRLRKRSTVYNCALVSNQYSQPTITMQYANLMSVVDGSLQDEERQARHIHDGVEVQKLKKTYSVEVPARTLESVLDGVADLPRIDFFSLDVEGFELSVLQGLNLERYRPRYILVEANFYDEVNELLTANDYRQLEKLSYHDYLYKDRRTE